MRAIFFTFMVTLFTWANALADEKINDSYSLTIYSKVSPGSISPSQFRPAPGGSYGYSRASAIPGYAIIRKSRNIELKNKRNIISLTDVAAFIDPTTVIFKSRSYPEQTHVLEQDYLFDLVSRDALLKRYIDKELKVEQIVGNSLQTYEGTLMSTLGGLVLQNDDDQLVTLSNYSNITLPELPGGLITKPTLKWDILTDKPGKHDIEMSYQTDGITWWADYNLVFSERGNANAGLLDVNAWVSIVNQSGATYPEAKLKLMAGDVQRVTPSYPRVQKSMLNMYSAKEMAMDNGFAEKTFFEYHLYTLGRPITLPQNSTKQLELLPTVLGVPTKKEFFYTGQRGNKVGVYLKFKNAKENKMGMPLPAGRVRISKQDSDGSLEFIGEDIIKHTAKNEEVRLKLGNAFDIVGERKQINYRVDTSRKRAEETIEVTLRNHKDESVKVIIEERLNRYSNWKITRFTDKWKKHDAFTIRFPVTLKKDEEKTVRYTAKYTW